METTQIEELEKKINSMKSVCADGRKEIKGLLEVAFGIKFSTGGGFLVRPGDHVSYTSDTPQGLKPATPVEYIFAQVDKWKYQFVRLDGKRSWSKGHQISIPREGVSIEYLVQEHAHKFKLLPRPE